MQLITKITKLQKNEQELQDLNQTQSNRILKLKNIKQDITTTFFSLTIHKLKSSTIIVIVFCISFLLLL